ncbi:MAG TPA: mevalonate kinase [Anaerolineales bacterium]
MPAYSASAPGKIILFGEHAVVYGYPAIAAPVLQVRAKAIANTDPRGTPGSVKIKALDLGLETTLADLPVEHPLAAVLWKAAAAMKLSHIPACSIQVSSSIPMAGGMGSSAAVSVAILRAFSALVGLPLSDEQVSQLAYEVEVIQHGTPSGIDNSVITYARPVYFIKGKPIETLQVKRPFTLVIGDTGIQSPTANVVNDVRQAWEKASDQVEGVFERIGAIATSAREAIQQGSVEALGPLMEENQALLRKLDVSSAELEGLVEAAHSAGALGAKLSGAGRGGNMIALATPENAEEIAQALKGAGAARTIITEIRTP